MAKATTTKARKTSAKKPAADSGEIVLCLDRPSCSLIIIKYAANRFVWQVQWSPNNFSYRTPHDLDESGKTTDQREAVSIAWDILCDHLDIE